MVQDSTLTARNNLALAYREAGRTAEAIPLYEQTLADFDRLLGTDHPSVLTSRNNLVPRLSTFAPLVCGEPAGPQGLIPAAQASRAASPPTGGLVPSG